MKNKVVHNVGMSKSNIILFNLVCIFIIYNYKQTSKSFHFFLCNKLIMFRIRINKKANNVSHKLKTEAPNPKRQCKDTKKKLIKPLFAGSKREICKIYIH